jgi:hypothetical protein
MKRSPSILINKINEEYSYYLILDINASTPIQEQGHDIIFSIIACTMKSSPSILINKINKIKNINITVAWILMLAPLSRSRVTTPVWPVALAQ